MTISLAGGISIDPLAEGISIPGGISLGAAALFGNIITGLDSTNVGYSVDPAYGSIDDTQPDPPGGGTTLFNIFQAADLSWNIKFSTAQVAQAAWTSVTLDNDIDAPIVLTSAAATYTAFVFTTPITSQWVFGATADLWNKLGAGAGVRAIFA